MELGAWVSLFEWANWRGAENKNILRCLDFLSYCRDYFENFRTVGVLF